MLLRTKLLAPIAVIFVLMAASALAWSFVAQRSNALDDASSALDHAAERRARLFQDALEERSELVILIAETKRVTDLESAIVEDSVKKVLLTHNLASLMERYSTSRFDHVYVYDNLGRDVISFEHGERLMDLSAPPAHPAEPFLSYFRNATTEESTIRLTVEGNATHVVFAAPVRDQRANVAGVVVAAEALADLAPSGLDEGAEATLTLYDALGTDVLGGGPRRLNVASLTAGARVVGGEIVATRVVSETVISGDEVTSLVLVAYRPTDEVTASAWGDVLQSAATLFAILLAIGGVVAIVVGRATRPIGKIDSTVSRIGGGDYAARAPAEGSDELVHLAVGINMMAEQLASREKQLRCEVESRSRSERLATLGSLSAGVAHEVNNPLTFMRAGNELSLLLIDERLADPALAGQERAILEEIKGDIARNTSGIDRIARIVGSLRLLAKPQREQTSVSLAAVIEATTSLAATRLKDLDGIEVDVPEDVMVTGSFDSIGQVLLNLLLNAVDATPNGTGHVRIVASQAGGSVKLSVEDNGPGITPEFKARLFTPFATTKANGTGLGLSICQRIMEEHGGSIRHEDRVGGGSRFVLEFPAGETSVESAQPAGVLRRPKTS